MKGIRRVSPSWAGARALGDPLLALHLPELLEWPSYNVGELAARSSPTLRSALERVARYASLFCAHLSFGCEETASEFVLTQRLRNGARGGRYGNEDARWRRCAIRRCRSRRRHGGPASPIWRRSVVRSGAGRAARRARTACAAAFAKSELGGRAAERALLMARGVRGFRAPEKPSIPHGGCLESARASQLVSPGRRRARAFIAVVEGRRVWHLQDESRQAS